jgi:hypothetical protein
LVRDPRRLRLHRACVPAEEIQASGLSRGAGGKKICVKWSQSTRRNRAISSSGPFWRVSLRRAKSRSRRPIDDNGA